MLSIVINFYIITIRVLLMSIFFAVNVYIVRIGWTFMLDWTNGSRKEDNSDGFIRIGEYNLEKIQPKKENSNIYRGY